MEEGHLGPSLLMEARLVALATFLPLFRAARSSAIAENPRSVSVTGDKSLTSGAVHASSTGAEPEVFLFPSVYNGDKIKKNGAVFRVAFCCDF